MSVITVNDGEAVFDCAEGDTLLRAGLRAGWRCPTSAAWAPAAAAAAR
jgi:hypothetical protein